VRFPADWIDDTGKSVGNTTIATLGASSTTLPGVPQSDGTFLFRPANDSGDEQKMLNIFYFCNYMHDFLFILGFDEAAGNFQKINFANVGLGNDPVRARAHSGAVSGTANMSTGPDGQPPLMNMGLVVGSGRHTAFDFDVVAHEYTHGLTNRLVGGRINAHALEELQSGGMGEGWSDFFALTIQSFLQGLEKVVVGDWVVNGAGGIRRAPYDDQYPFHYGQLVDFPEVHDIGEVWCAARSTLGDDDSGYRLAWQLVVDALKVTPTNPTFLDGRDAILRALDDLLAVDRIPADVHRRVRAAIWRAFAAFGSRRLQCRCRRSGDRCRQHRTSRPHCVIQRSYIGCGSKERTTHPRVDYFGCSRSCLDDVERTPLGTRCHVAVARLETRAASGSGMADRGSQRASLKQSHVVCSLPAYNLES
jgi:extracellular elastinolytic metalloproteinase